MQNSLPVYDNIVNRITSEQVFNISIEDKNKLIDDITTNIDTHELVFVIIRLYQVKNSNNVSSLPYQSKFLKTKKGYKFDIENLPSKLLYILIEFYKLHYNSKK